MRSCCARRSRSSLVYQPCFKALRFPTGAPEPGAPPCIRQRFFPLTAGERHAFPERVLAPQRGLWPIASKALELVMGIFRDQRERNAFNAARTLPPVERFNSRFARSEVAETVWCSTITFCSPRCWTSKGLVSPDKGFRTLHRAFDSHHRAVFSGAPPCGRIISLVVEPFRTAPAGSAVRTDQ